MYLQTYYLMQSILSLPIPVDEESKAKKEKERPNLQIKSNAPSTQKAPSKRMEKMQHKTLRYEKEMAEWSHIAVVEPPVRG